MPAVSIVNVTLGCRDRCLSPVSVFKECVCYSKSERKRIVLSGAFIVLKCKGHTVLGLGYELELRVPGKAVTWHAVPDAVDFDAVLPDGAGHREEKGSPSGPVGRIA